MTRLLICISCGSEEERNTPGRTLYCTECKERKRREAVSAIGKVLRAVKAGVIPKATTMQCVDCSAPAAQYDHRDYAKPLQVEAVCVPCNQRRGPALNSQMRSFQLSKKAI